MCDLAWFDMLATAGCVRLSFNLRRRKHSNSDLIRHETVINIKRLVGNNNILLQFTKMYLIWCLITTRSNNIDLVCHTPSCCEYNLINSYFFVQLITGKLTVNIHCELHFYLTLTKSKTKIKENEFGVSCYCCRDCKRSNLDVLQNWSVPLAKWESEERQKLRREWNNSRVSAHKSYECCCWHTWTVWPPRSIN